MKAPAVHLVDEGVYLVEQVPWHATLECDGLPVKAPFVTASLDKVVLVRRLPAEITHYENSEGDPMPREMYSSMFAELTKARDEDGDWNDLDAEYAFRKFEQAWRPVRGEPQTLREPVEFEVVEVRVNSGDPDIVSLWNAPSVHHDRRLYSLNRTAVSWRLAREISATYGLGIEIPGHGGARYAKVGDKYLYGTELDFGNQPFIGTLDACKAEKQRIDGLVRGPLAARAADRRGSPVPNAGALLLKLREALLMLQGAVAKTGSAGHLSAGRRALTEVIEQLQAYCIEEVKS